MNNYYLSIIEPALKWGMHYNHSFHTLSHFCDTTPLVIKLTHNILVDKALIFYELLDSREKFRAHKITHNILRDKFIIQHAVLKILLSLLLNEDIRKIIIITDYNNKPRVKNNILKFNMSHSDNYTLYAFCEHYEVGIDLEEESRTINYDLVAKVCAPCELEKLNALSTKERAQAFLRLWSQKEALSKAIGLGLLLDFKELVISRLEKLNNYRFYDISLSPLFFASLVVKEHEYVKSR
jgi:4'-phosphopantetheinyl transferase